MHRRPVVILILYFNLIFLSSIRTQTVFDVLESEKNNFTMKSAFLHNVSIKTFNFLDLEQKYVKLNKSQTLLTMFKRQYHIAENLLGTFDEIQNMTASNITGNSFKLRNILEDIIREEMHHSRNYDVKKSSVNMFDQEFSVFVDIFFDKALKISMKNVKKLTNRVLKSPILDTPWKRTRDIKVWKPSSVEHFNLFNNTRRIYKGKKAKIKDFPFLVSILYNNEFTSAGSIISKDLVITAATGLNVLYKSEKYQELLNSVFVRVGSDYAAKEGNLVSVVDVIFHPGYDPHSLQNNLAILKLVKRLRFSNKRKIQRILFDKKGVFKKNSLVIVLGWGAKDANKEVNLKQKVSVARLNLFDMDKCATMYSGFYVKDSNFCAGFSDKGGGACNKDTGGPGIVGGELAGVISFGPSVCGQAASPTVFTKIAANVEWITSVVNRERSLKIETTTTGQATTGPATTGPERTTEQTLFPITNTKPANHHQTPLQTPLPAPRQLVSDSLRSLRPIIRVPTQFKLKQREKLHRFVTVSPALSNISLPFSTTYFHPTLFSESASLTTEMYPDQTIILKEILKEIILSNTSVIDYILYGSILEDNVESKYLLSTTEAVDVMQHQLVNKSVFLIENAEEIIHPVRSKTIVSKPIVKNSYESISDDEGNISPQIELLNSIYSQPDKPDTSKHIEDNINFNDKTESQYNIEDADISNNENSEKKVTNRLRNTILYGNKRNSNEIADDLSSKIRDETKDEIDDYYDDESNGKTTKHYEKQTKTKQSTTSTTDVLKKYKNVVFNLDDFDPENRQDKTDQIVVDKYSGKNVDDEDIKPQYNNKNVLKEGQGSKPYKMDGIGEDQYREFNGGDKKQQYHLKEKRQDEMDRMGRDYFGDDFNKNQEHKKNYFNENQGFKSNEKVQIRDDKYNDKKFNDKGKPYDKEYFGEKTENKQDEIDRMGKYSSNGDDNYSKRYQTKNYLQETPDYNQNKGGRMEIFTNSAHNYDYDDFNEPQKTTEKFSAIGKGAAIPNDEFDYNYKDSLGQNTYKSDRPRLGTNDKSDYKQRPMTDEDEKIARYDENFVRKSNKRHDYKKSNHGDDFLSILK